MQNGQFLWGGALLNCNEGVHKVKYYGDGNIIISIRIEIGLTVRHTSQTDTKVGSNDPLVLCG